METILKMLATDFDTPILVKVDSGVQTKLHN